VQKESKSINLDGKLNEFKKAYNKQKLELEALEK
jgi:hypothetical protein